MLPRKHRLSTDEFMTVMEKGRVSHSPLFLVRTLSGVPGLKFAAVAPKKIAKTAVMRNRIRRQIYEAVAEAMKGIGPGAHLLIFAKDAATQSSHAERVIDLKNVFVKAGILK